MGMKVMVSTTPTAQYMGAVAIRPISRPLPSGRVPKIRHTATGNSISITITERFQIRPQECTWSM